MTQLVGLIRPRLFLPPILAVVLVAAGCAQGAGRVTPRPAPTDTPVEPSATPSSEATPVRPLTEAVVAVAPPGGPPGTEVQVTAAGFPPDTEIEVGVGRRGSVPDSMTTVRSDADGVLTTALAIPTSAEPEEAWVVVASTQDDEIQATSNVFQVTAPQYEPQLSIAPPDGPPGTQVDVTAEGLPPGATVEIGVGRENAEYDVVDTVQTESDGSLTAQVAIPPYAEPDERWVVVVTTQDRSLKAVSNVFQVGHVNYQGTVAISPRRGPPGTRVQVVARGFPPNASMEIGVGRVNSEYDVVATARTDANGRVDTEITMPTFVEPEDRWVIVVAAEHQPVKVTSDEFDVTGAPTPGGDRGSEGLFTRTNIYLIAIGDDGRSGKEIGCDDSVVPVEVQIEPTIAPLTAALNKLLSIGTREYGMSGYYNALYQSDLALEGINIKNREAIIRLSGALTLGGVCDEPRVRAQLRQTALQYVTVDRVSIFINGTPLEELLGG